MRDGATRSNASMRPGKSDIARRAHAILYVNLLRLIEIANTVTEMFAYYQLRSGFRQGASV